MPTYEYLCKQCTHRFEAVQKMIDEPLTICPECGGAIRRVLFPAGIVFKGSGFYKTDHANVPRANENGHSPKSDGAETTKAGETSTATSGESKSTNGPGSSDTGAKTSAKAGESKVTAATK